MSIDYSQLAQPKGKTRAQLKAKRDREDAKQLKAFQDGVWNREATLSNGGNITPQVARCQQCGDLVVRVIGSPRFGHVHHNISRRHKATRYSISNGQLLCRSCHNSVHGREF